MESKHLNEGKINPIIGTALGFGFVSPKQLPYIAAILLVCIPIILTNLVKGILFFVCVYGLFWVLTGNDPSKFFERFTKPKRYLAKEPQTDFDRGGIPKPEKSSQTSVNYEIRGKKVSFQYVEHKFRLRTYGQIELDAKKIGFYLLQRGPYAMIIFCWRIAGYDPSLTENQASSLIFSGTDALNQLPKDIDLKCYQEINSSSAECSKMQQELLKNNDLDPLSEEIINSREERGKELAREGRLQTNNLLIFAKYRVPLGADFAVKHNWLDDLLSQTQPIVGMIRGQKFDSQKAWEKVISSAYSYAYQKVNNLLTSNKGFGLQVSSLSVDRLWARDYLELHRPPVIPIPQYVVYNDWGLQNPIINSATHVLGSLFAPQKGIATVPRFDNDYVYFPNKNKYVAFVRIGQIYKFPKDKRNVSLGYLRYLWNIVADKKALTDCRIVSELTIDRSGFEKIQLDRIISNSIKREAIAAARKTVDVVALRRREQAIEARELLEDNHVPFWVSSGIWLYRDSKEVLENDISDLCQQIPSATVERIEYGIENIWFQTWAFEWEAFLTKPDHRRQKYYSFQSLPLMPLIKTKGINRKGIMFLTRELNTAVFLDIVYQKNHTGIFAKTGAGKSNVILEMLLQYKICNQLAVLFDFPRPDGSSTYTVLIPLLRKLGVRVAYHNVRKNVINIIEMPDLRGATSTDNYWERWNDAFNAQVRLLCAIVIGISNNPDREILVSSLLTDCYYDFHQEPTIKQRYTEAIAGGYGSDAYQKMPIYEEFVIFADRWFANYVEKKQNTNSELSRETIDLILIQLHGVLKTPLGRSINGISSFDLDTDILIIGLTEVSENLDSLLYAMTGLNALYRGAFSAKRSLLGIDEGTILYKFRFFARETGIIPVHGRKWGCNFLIAAQEVKSIQDSIVGGEIFKNFDNIFCGRIEDTAIAEMKDLGFREPILANYVTESFDPDKELLQSYWYLKRGDRHIELTHPLSKLILALGATEPEEEAVRKDVLALYENKIEGIKKFGEINAIAKQSGRALRAVMREETNEAA